MRPFFYLFSMFYSHFYPLFHFDDITISEHRQIKSSQKVNFVIDTLRDTEYYVHEVTVSDIERGE